jgi:hypothetical protein
MGQRVSVDPSVRAGRHARRGVASLLAMLYLVVFAALALGFYAHHQRRLPALGQRAPRPSRRSTPSTPASSSSATTSTPSTSPAA